MIRDKTRTTQDLDTLTGNCWMVRRTDIIIVKSHWLRPISRLGLMGLYDNLHKCCFLPPANEVWGKVIFSVACVKNSVHRGGGVCLSACWDTTPRRHPPTQCMLGDTVTKWAVCILLECNLVCFVFIGDRWRGVTLTPRSIRYPLKVMATHHRDPDLREGHTIKVVSLLYNPVLPKSSQSVQRYDRVTISY